MQNMKDFEIEDGILRRYYGHDSDVVIPDSVTRVGANAFYGDKILLSVVIPNGVTSIDHDAFYRCRNLTRVVIPDGVASIGENAFHGCENLTSIVIPDSVTSIGEDAFHDCTSLEHFVVKNPGCKLGLSVFGQNIPEKLKGNLFPLYQNFSDLCIAKYMLQREYWSSLDDEKKAELFFSRHAKALEPQYLDCVTRADAKMLGETLLPHLGEKASAKDCASAAALMLLFTEYLPAPLMQKLYHALGKAKNGKKALDKVNEEETVMAALKTSEGNADELPPAEKRFAEILAAQGTSRKNVMEKLKSYYSLTDRELPKISYTDGRDADPVVLAWLLQLHEKKSDDRWADPLIYEAFDKPGVCPEAEEIIAYLDQETFQNALRELALNNLGAYGQGRKLYIANPVCRYADRKLMEELTAIAPKWGSRTMGDYAPPLRVFRQACIYSNERCAILFAEKYNDLYYYARLRDTTADTIRDTILSNLGLDADGKKSYDLGNTTVTVSLQPDLTLSLFDERNHKTVRSMPRKGNSEELVSAASTDYSELKKNIKKVARNRCDNLFSDFLSGKEKKSSDWKSVYLVNPLLRQIANLLVWEQDNMTFTLSDRDAVFVDGTAYAITDSPIRLAHPMEMKQEEIKAWQKYFSTIKQPFAQIWEPVYDLASIDQNRYNGIHIPAYRFSKQEKHGIDFSFDYGLSEAYLNLIDCELEFDEGTAIARHWLDLKGELILGKFTVEKSSRQANHIVSLLDKWTIYGRIINDDVTILEQIGNANVAQVMEYIRVAGENNAVSVTAALMEYKNEHFSDFDPMDEYVL